MFCSACSWQASRASIGTGEFTDVLGTTVTDARLLVRAANVVVRTSLWHGDRPGAPAQRRLPLDGARVQEGLRDAVRDALSVWDATVLPEPVPGQDGPIATLPNPCRILAQGVAGVLPRARPVDLSAPGAERLRGCRWQPRPYGDLVQVTAYAAGPNGITGATAVEEATDIVAADNASLWEPVRGPWDEAWHDDRDPDGERLVVRVDNLVLVVQAALRDAHPDLTVARRTASRLARAYVAAVRASSG